MGLKIINPSSVFSTGAAANSKAAVSIYKCAFWSFYYCKQDKCVVAPKGEPRTAEEKGGEVRDERFNHLSEGN